MLFCARQTRLCFKMQCSASLPVSVWMKFFIFQPHNKVLCYRACMLQFILYLSTQAGIRVTWILGVTNFLQSVVFNPASAGPSWITRHDQQCSFFLGNSLPLWKKTERLLPGERSSAGVNYVAGINNQFPTSFLSITDHTGQTTASCLASGVKRISLYEWIY